MDDTKQFPYEFLDIDSKDAQELVKNFGGVPEDFVRVGPKGYFTPREYVNHAASIYNMPLRPSDIFVMSYQRSGTTMTQEVVWLLAKDFDYETAKSTRLVDRYPFLEFLILINKQMKEKMQKQLTGTEQEKTILKELEKSAVEVLATTPDPRFIKTHLPLSLLPPKTLDTAKAVYVARDPRDVAVSSYHHFKFFMQMDNRTEFKHFWNLFKNNLSILTPYFDHVKEAWAQRNHPNMLFLFYEDLRKDLPACIRKIAKFLGKDPTEEQIAGLCDHMNIENFQKNKAVNFEEMRDLGLLHPEEKFIRKGKTGGWRNYFNEEMTAEAERWIVDNLRDSDLRFPSMNDIHV